ncbi:MAG: hypothetical protein Q7T33_04750 [Dehalococcoidia bacterium]|nr:hypothetical protein [Dehalococcoidia bacterium]
METTAFKFRELGSALSFQGRCLRLMRLVLGDDEMFWVVTPADAARLERLGYELVG